MMDVHVRGIDPAVWQDLRLAAVRRGSSVADLIEAMWKSRDLPHDHNQTQDGEAWSRGRCAFPDECIDFETRVPYMRHADIPVA
jgi:hypothetical protein